ncbi:MAG TPA: HEAT repeat domain-containing protein [Polyangiaceae bacterium]|nr:HEAT repeat domain-containing protein [Polyangiaceae bacterium]
MFAELVRGATVDAVQASLPAPIAPDRRQRIQELVEQLARSGPESHEPMRARLLKFGEDALPILTGRFPGSLWVDLSRPHRPLESAAHASGLAAAMVAFGELAVPYVERLLRAPRAEVRVTAALVATDLKHGQLVKPLATRLQDEVPLVRRAAMIALRACADLPEAMHIRAELLQTAENRGQENQWRRKAIWMIGQLRDADAVPRLIELLSDSAVSEVARETLVRLVGRDVGRFRFSWRSWWKSQGPKGRLRWLVVSLDQEDAKQRVQVADELVLLTGRGFDRRHAVATREQARGLGEYYLSEAPDR